MIEAREGLVFDSDSPGYLFVRAPGAYVMRFTVKGLEAHAGMAPERGISAIKVAAEAIAAMRLGRIDHETTANVGTIEGGRALNIVPNEVVVRAEARSRDASKLAAQVEHMVDCFKQAVARAKITVEGRSLEAALDYTASPEYGAMNVPDDAPIVRKVVEAARRAGRVVKP
jgi:tripeptide aminopeptidase